MPYTKLLTIQNLGQTDRSPVVFVHGFPDSPDMFRDYYSQQEQQQAWLRGRSIYAIAFPNRHNNPGFPNLCELAGDVVAREFDEFMDGLVQSSPTGKIVPIVHDWGATHTWRWVRARGGNGVEKMVALSVGSSFRYDIFEHGLNAFTWMYGLWFGAAWYVPFLRQAVARSIVGAAGYRSETAMDLWKDAFHYWDRFSLLLTILPQALGLLFYQKEYVDFPFPVLYMRSKLDRIASTFAFEQTVRSRADCCYYVLDGVNHWFPEQQSNIVLEQVRAFLA